MLDKRDPQGRQFIAMHDVRSAIVSSAATLTTGSPTSLILGDTDYFLDIFEIQMSNNSTASVGLDLINDGTIIRHYDIPANNTFQFRFDTPLRQQTKNTPWIVDLDDVTGTSVQVAARLIKQDK